MIRYQHSHFYLKKYSRKAFEDYPNACSCLAAMSKRAPKIFVLTSVLLIVMLLVYVPLMVKHVHQSRGLLQKSCGTKSECDRKRELAKAETIRKKLLQPYDVKKINVKENDTDKIHLFTKKLWHFKRAEAERIYLYHKILTSEWTMNRKNLRRMSYELRNHSKIEAADFVLSQHNIDVNSTLDYYIFSKLLLKTDSYYHFHMNEDIFEKLPQASPYANKIYDRCSVVGNSGILLNSGCGEDIDKSDFIFRCNLAPIEPYKEDAGSKSNLTTMNPSIFHKRFGELKTQQDMLDFMGNVSEYNGYIWMPCFSASHLNEICIKAFNNYSIGRPEVLLANPDHFVKIWKFWSARNHTKLLSSGFYITHVALQLCKEVHLYGFWPFPVSVDQDVVKEQPCHYFNNMTFTKSHNMDDEFRLLFQMHQHGLLRMHVGQCGNESTGSSTDFDGSMERSVVDAT